MHLSVAVLGLSCWAGFSLVVVLELLIEVAALVEPGLRAQRLRWLWYMGSRAQAQQFGSVAPLCVGSSWTRDGTHVSCIAMQILYH